MRDGLVPGLACLRRRTVLAGLAASVLCKTGGKARAGEVEKKTMKIILSVNGTSLPATLDDNPSARDFIAMLPLDLSMEDYVGKEKIGYLPRKLVTTGAGPFSGEAPGDICYYAPWGNLAIFYGSYRFSSGLIRLGRLDGPVRPLQIDQPFSIRIQAAPEP